MGKLQSINHPRRLFWLAGLLLFLLGATSVTRADEPEVKWSEPINLSRSPEKNSLAPFLLADPAGMAHLFWGEKVTSSPARVADTLMYASWDGRRWSRPIDIFFAPSSYTSHLLAPQAVLDDEGFIHLIWMAEVNSPDYALYYSVAHASEAASAAAWQRPLQLADDLTGTNFSIALAYEAPGKLHVLYARVPQGGVTRSEPRAVSYMRSTDGGESWSRPEDLHLIPSLDHGASNTRLLAVPPGRIYAVWTVWNELGNGQAVYFARSLDGGTSWEEPLMLTETAPGEYERDWPNLHALEDGSLVVAWEGGFRAYRHMMYSGDGGASWSEPIDAFPGLIGENGYALFANDSTGRLHLFVAQRIREGNPSNLVGGLGLWHSTWEGGSQWSRPTLANRPIDMVDPTVVIVGGNQVVAAWYSNLAFEIMVMSGELLDAPALEPEPWPTQSGRATATVTATEAPLPAAAPEPGEMDHPPEASWTAAPPVSQSRGPGRTLLVALFPALLILAGVLFTRSRHASGRR